MAGLPAIAQEQKETAILTTPRERMHEMGIFSQVYPDDQGVNMLGLQYTRWKNEQSGIKFIASYGSYRSFSSPIQVIIPDTVVMRKSTTQINLGIIGAGITKQYHVNKSLYLFATMELKGGYGSGSVDTTVVKQYIDNEGAKETAGNLFHDQDVSMLYVAFNPAIGFKFQGRRITAAIEILPLEMNYTSRHYSRNASTSLFDFSAGLLQQRLSVSYRF